jgi:hypothetical protein
MRLGNFALRDLACHRVRSELHTLEARKHFKNRADWYLSNDWYYQLAYPLSREINTLLKICLVRFFARLSKA